MTEKRLQTLRLYYGIALAALTAIVGVLFIVQVLRIYNSAENSPYSRELVTKMLGEISVVVWIWVAAVVSGGALCVLYPQSDKVKAQIPPEITLEKLQARLPEKNEKIENFRKDRKFVWLCVLEICLFCASFCATYLFNPHNFPATDGGGNVTGEVLKMVWTVLPVSVVTFASCIAGSLYSAYSVKKEIEETKSLIAENAKNGVKTAQKTAKIQEKSRLLKIFKSEKCLLWARIAVAAVGVLLVTIGIFNGGMNDVLAKAIKICTECIGLG